MTRGVGVFLPSHNKIHDTHTTTVSSKLSLMFMFIIAYKTIATGEDVHRVLVWWETIEWDVCRFLTGTQTRHVLSRPSPTVSPFQVLHYSSFMLAVLEVIVSLLLLKHASPR